MISWKIENVIVKPSEGAYSDVVVTANWRCSATDSGYESSQSGVAGFVLAENNFIPYESLTEQDVLGWVWSSGLDKGEVEAGVSRDLETLKNPPFVVKPLPWGN